MAAAPDMVATAVETAAPQPDLWRAVDALIDRAPSLAALHEHRLDLLAAQRWRACGRPVPEAFMLAERAAAVADLAVRPLLERARDAIGAPLLLLKGPEIAALYPHPTLRAFGDLDLLVEDAGAAQRSLLAAGFEEVGDPALYVGIHHLRPLRWRGLPLWLEVHEHPKWTDRSEPPPFAALAEAAKPSALGVEGVQAPAFEHHAVLVAVHSWVHQPLRQISELVDVAALSRAAGGEQHALALEAVARDWGVSRLWRTVSRAAEAVLFCGRQGWHLRTWARSVATAHQRTVFGTHLEGLLAPFGAAPPAPALADALAALIADVRPKPSEPWTRKSRRTGRALRDAFAPRAEHDEDLAERRLL